MRILNFALPNLIDFFFIPNIYFPDQAHLGSLRLFGRELITLFNNSYYEILNIFNQTKKIYFNCKSELSSRFSINNQKSERNPIF